MQQGLATEDIQIANIAAVQDVNGAIKLIGIDPAQVAFGNFSVGKIAKITTRIAGVGHGDVANRGTAAGNEAQHVPGFGSEVRQWCAP
jgi:hypothetical protein